MSEQPYTRHRADARLIAAMLASLVVAVGAFTHGGQDDTFITYWPAYTLSQSWGILNYNGEVLEQSSSLGLVVLLAALHSATRVDLPTLGYLVGLASLLGSLWFAGRIGSELEGKPAAWAVALSVGTIPCFAYWSTSGMETALVVLTGLWSVRELGLLADGCADTRRRVVATTGALLCFASMRPETPLIAAGLLAVAVVLLSLKRHRAALKRNTPAAVAGLVGIAAVVGFRLLYFGRWAPNSALVKLGGFDVRTGLRYLFESAVVDEPFVLPGLVFATCLSVWRVLREARSPNESRKDGWTLGVLLCAFGGSYAVFIVVSGGDWMPGSRFYALFAPAAMLATWGLIGRTGGRVGAALALVLAGSHLLIIGDVIAQDRLSGRPLWRAPEAVARARESAGDSFPAAVLANKYYGQIAPAAAFMVEVVEDAYEHLGRPVTLMSGQAGLQPFWVFRADRSKVHFYDLWSITDASLYECVGASAFGHSRVGTTHNVAAVLDGLAQDGPGCGLGGVPDIYFTGRINPSLRRQLTRHGYVEVYHNPDRSGYVSIQADLAEAIGLHQ